MAKKVRKEPDGVVLSADSTGPLHVELRARAGMPQAFQVRFDGKVQKMKGIRVKTLVDPRPYGTLVLDFLTVNPKPWPRLRRGVDSLQIIQKPIKAKKAKAKPKKTKK